MKPFSTCAPGGQCAHRGSRKMPLGSMLTKKVAANEKAVAVCPELQVFLQRDPPKLRDGSSLELINPLISSKPDHWGACGSLQPWSQWTERMVNHPLLSFSPYAPWALMIRKSPSPWCDRRRQCFPKCYVFYATITACLTQVRHTWVLEHIRVSTQNRQNSLPPQSSPFRD